MDLVVREIPWLEPADAFARWADDPHVALLDSAGPIHERARHAYLAVEPFRVLGGHGRAVLADGEPIEGDAFAVLARELARWTLPEGAGPVPFAGGAAGLIGYELAAQVEGRASRHRDTIGLDDWSIGFYDLVLGFDRVEQRAWIMSSGFPEVGAARQERAERRLAAALDRLAQPAPIPPSVPPITWRLELDQADYESRVGAVIEHIRAGDIYQANFTVRHLAERPLGVKRSAFYAALKGNSPAPFAAYVGCGAGLAIASASPERFIRLEADGRIETRPIKGTRPRGATPEQDDAYRRELIESAKDRAENLMIVDLLRNDIGRVAEIGSVAVPSLFEIESFASVHHLVSAVTGQLRAGLGAADLLRATLPGGSITGAPKIRAMEIIDDLELARRGPYCGIALWIGFDGAMDSSILIRTLVITPEILLAQAGGGIIADSDPAAEFDEMMVKVTPVLVGRAR